MAISAPGFAWPARWIPEVTIAGRAPLDARGFAYKYFSPTHAVHLHNYYGRVNIDGVVYELAPGDITFSPAFRPSSYDLPQPGWHWCVHFRPARRRTNLLYFPRRLSLGPRQAHGGQRMERLAELWSRVDPHTPQGRLAQASLAFTFQDFMLWLAEALLSPAARYQGGRHGRSAVQRAATWIAGHFNEPLTIPDLADRLGVSQNYLARLFRRRFGMTMPRYLLTQRLEYARHLLSNTDMAIAHIARQVGLPDPRHFNKQFRRMYGRAPSAIRQIHERHGHRAAGAPVP